MTVINNVGHIDLGFHVHVYEGHVCIYVQEVKFL